MRMLESTKNYLLGGIIFVVGTYFLLTLTNSYSEDMNKELGVLRQEIDTLRASVHEQRQESNGRGDLLVTGSNPVGIKRGSEGIKMHDLDPTATYPRILCWVMTDPAVLNRTLNAKNTWTRRCDKVLFMSSQRNDDFPTIGLNVTAGRNHIAAKCRASWIYIYEHFINDYDYFVKADPDTYIIVENLKEYLSHFNPETPQFFGHKYNISTGIYMAGGPGVILSRAAARNLVVRILYNNTKSRKCIPDGQGEDWKICICLQKAGAKPVDTLDERGRERFFVLAMSHMFNNQFPKWYRQRDRSKAGKECCSDYPIGFHYVKKDSFLVMEYFLYHTKLKYKDEKNMVWQ